MNGCLGGIRIITLGGNWAGPHCGRILSELGAEVIRIGTFPPAKKGQLYPSTQEYDNWIISQLERGVPFELIPKRDKRFPGYVENYTPNNLGLGINLSTTKGKVTFKRLVRACDVVLDSFSPMVMANLGFDYPDLKEVKPDIIVMSMPALGKSGPYKDMRGHGTAVEQMAGLASITGYPGGPPQRAAVYICDGLMAVVAACAIMAALNYRRQTGKGQFIDFAQAEGTTCFLGEALMDYSMNRRVTRPAGNYHPVYAPHGCYRCKGDDMWVTIVVTSEEEWTALCQAMGNPPWADEDRFSDMFTRWRNKDELDSFIEQWTSQYDHYTIQETLQQAGVAAGAVTSIEEHITSDPQIQERQLYQYIKYPPSKDWPEGRVDPVFRVPWVMPQTPTSLTKSAPYVGRDNYFILHNIAGLSDQEITDLETEGVIGEDPPDN